MRRGERPGDSNRLSAYWDARGRSQAEAAAGAAELDPNLIETIEKLHAHDDAQLPDPRFLARLESTLMQATAAPAGLPASDAPTSLAPNGRGPAVPRLARLSPTPSAPRWHREWLASLATAALVALALVGSFFIFGPGRPQRRADMPALLPALNETPTTTDTIEAPVAEFVWETSGGPDVPFEDKPAAVTVDPDGNLWVLDAPRSQFQIFSPDRTFLESWGTPGSGPGEFNFPVRTEANRATVDVAFDRDGSFYVSDLGNFRIQKFGPDRAFLAAWGSRATRTVSFSGQARSRLAIRAKSTFWTTAGSTCRYSTATDGDCAPSGTMGSRTAGSTYRLGSPSIRRG